MWLIGTDSVDVVLVCPEHIHCFDRIDHKAVHGVSVRILCMGEFHKHGWNLLEVENLIMECPC
jgi:hypothetical protein